MDDKDWKVEITYIDGTKEIFWSYQGSKIRESFLLWETEWKGDVYVSIPSTSLRKVVETYYGDNQE